jgi:hypothetical protein
MKIENLERIRSAGYSELIKRYALDVIPNWHTSAVAATGTHRTETAGGTVTEIYPPSYWPGDSSGDHLEFALKYDGTNLGILAAVFSAAEPSEIVSYIESKPLGKYTRRIWFLYEFLKDERLPLDDLNRGNYVDLLDADHHCVVTPPTQMRRQRVNNNLLGNRSFCPVVRRTATLRDFEAANLSKRCREVVARYSPEMLRRAMSYLYTKETKSSFEIEHIKPTTSRTERFIALLQSAEQEDFCTKDRLVDLHNRTVDPRFRDDDYRTSQNYVGESIAWRHERVHYACPTPEAVPELMAGLVNAHKAMESGGAPPVVHAATVAYGFVFIHPFEDGNGRIHRFLIHNILARRGFSPPGVVLPVSAAMLKDPAEYDASLQSFSRPFMALVEYDLDERGRMTVTNDVRRWYAYPDMTPQVEALFRFIERTVGRELVDELTFIENHDRTKRAIQDIVDLPDRKIDLFIRFCLQNNGRLSARKRSAHFEMLTDDEIQGMEVAVQAGYTAGPVREG